MAKAAASRRSSRRPARAARPKRSFDALPDPADFRDQLFAPTLVEVPVQRPLSTYLEARVPILDQQAEGACVGFALATVANYLLRTRRQVPDRARVSARMFYQMAKRYDEWPGEDYEGTSARGAMKGWHKHGVCGEKEWKYAIGKPDVDLTDARARDALCRPLGAYYRVNHLDLVALHTAISEVGILLATARVHEGWDAPRKDGSIELSRVETGGHAFAIVGYDGRGFWIQNSWGRSWGRAGFGLVSYDDWLINGMDTWVARLGAPVFLGNARATSVALSAAASKSQAYTFADLRPHIVSVGNDGRLRAGGTYGNTATDVARTFAGIAGLLGKWGGSKRRLLIYAHGGLVGEEAAVQRVADYRPALLDAKVYPLAFVWKTDFLTTLRNILEDAARRRRPEGAIETAKDFLFDRLDDMLEPLARALTGKAQWDEMKENARLASESPDGGARAVAAHVRDLAAAMAGKLEVHLVGHSAGAIFLGHFLRQLTEPGVGFSNPPVKVATCTLWAPACTLDLFDATYAPAAQGGKLGKLALYLLTDKAEQDDDCAGIYHKSLLYLVSNALERVQRIPLLRKLGYPLLGMERFASGHKALQQLVAAGRAEIVLAPNSEPADGERRSAAKQHGAFDDDRATVGSTLRRIVGGKGKVALEMHSSQASISVRRRTLERRTMAR
jgi:hypothetical protein